MIYSLILNSTTNTPLTNYFSANASGNRGQRVYAVDWTFLPENKKFKVTFKFASKKITALTADNIAYITANFSQPNHIMGSNLVRRNPTPCLGILKPNYVSAATDMQYSSNPTENQPTFLFERPSNNFLEITVLDLANTQVNITVDYLMVLYFEEIN
jgi:hypothetical protein